MTVSLQRYAAPPTPAELAARLALPIERIVKLDANESPWGPSPSARAALQAFAAQAATSLDGAGRYPDAAAFELRAALAGDLGLSPDSIVVGNGSDEILQLLAEALLETGDEVIVTSPTFSMYALNARRRGACVVDVPRDEKWNIPTQSLLDAMSERTRLVFLCSPNNPTGTPLKRATFDAALQRAQELASNGQPGPTLVVDEAYYEVGALAGDPRSWTAAPLVAASDGRLVVLRTFSKLFGLAGLRVGYGLCAPWVAERLRALAAPYNVNQPAQCAALAALRDLNWLTARADDLARERDRVVNALTARLGLRVWPSVANFVLADVAADAADAQRRAQVCDAIWQALLRQGVLVRRFSEPPLGGLLRITIGLPEQNDALLSALDRALTEKGDAS